MTITALDPISMQLAADGVDPLLVLRRDIEFFVRYAIERTSTFIKIYFWGRGSSSVPNDVQHPGTSVNTGNWGIPAASFPDTDCNFSTHFGPHNIIIDLTFCGDWAGNSAVYSASGCPSDCVDYVNQNPSAFVDAYFTFNSLNIYE